MRPSGTSWLRMSKSLMSPVRTGQPIREIVLERGLLDAKRLGEILSVESMTRPGIAGRKDGKGGGG